MENSISNESYQSPKTLSYIAIGLLGSMIFCYVLYILFSFGLSLYPDAVLEADHGENLPIAYILIGLVALFQIPLFIATVVFFLIWEYRAYKNLYALNADNLRHSPGWAVGWWFIPFANLVKPFQVMKEIWVESDPEYEAEYGFLSSSMSAPTIMGFWWAFWILGNISDRIASKLDGSPDFPVAMIISSSFSLIAAALLIKIILDITKRQELRSQRIEIQQPSMPPPPPTFG